MKFFVEIAFYVYQKFVSPYKGFKCAHAAYYQGSSCSHAIREIFLEHGFIKGYPLVRYRLKECEVAYCCLSISKDNDSGKKRRKKDKENNYDCSGAEDICNLTELLPRGCFKGRHDICDCDIGPCDLSP